MTLWRIYIRLLIKIDISKQKRMLLAYGAIFEPGENIPKNYIMQKALITISKRILFDKNSPEQTVKEMLQNIQKELESTIPENPSLMKFSALFPPQMTGLEGLLKNIAESGGFNFIRDTKGYIPGLLDCAGRIHLQNKTGISNRYGAEFSIIEFERGNQGALIVAIDFKTQQFLLLDSVGDRLLLTFPPATNTSEGTHTYTFFLKLTDDMYFSQYEVIK